ncbi:MAG: TolC family protein [Prevotellaceae bacterium]|jgi:outer membrane protein TolC|nr:TolC family protein [Prevotellaceae bacterium]
MKKVMLTVGCLLALTGRIAAQDADADTIKVDLGKALEIALSDNPLIKIAGKEIKRVDYSKKAAWYGLLPSLNGTGQYTRNVKLQTMALGGTSMKIGQDNAISLGLTLSLPIVAPALWRSIQMTSLEMQLASEKSRASKITLQSDVTKAYYSILLAQDSYKALQNGYDIAKQNYELAKQRYETGVAAEYDYVSAEVQMNNLLPNLLQVENGVAQAKMYLKVLMGVGAEVLLEIEGNLSDLEADVANAYNADSISLSSNTDLVQMDIQQKQLKKTLQIQRTQRMPTLAAFGNFQYQSMGDDKDKVGINMITQQPIVVPKGLTWYDPAISVGIQLNVPIFNGFTNTSKEKQMKIQMKQLELQREYLENSLSVQVRTALDNMEKAVKQMESNKKSVELAEKGYRISGNRYNTGMGTMLELNNSALALTQSQLSYNQAISDYLTAKADYEKIVGQERENKEEDAENQENKEETKNKQDN